MAWLGRGRQTYEVLADEPETVVGSGVDANWRVPDADLMPRHFTIAIDDESMAVVRPFTQDSVIAVNGEQVLTKGRALVDGDVVAAGSGQFVFSEDAPRVVTGTADDLADAYLIETKAGIAHLLEGRSTTIGRDASNAIIVRNPTASRFHAELRREAGGFALHSMGSAGTVRNGRLMNEPVLLGEGDQIEVAFTLFEFTRRPVEGRAEIAPRHSGENDDATRKPTVATEWVVDEDGEVVDSAPTASVVFGLLVVAFSFLSYIWLKLR